MGDYGNLAKAFNAENVKLQIGSGNELITLTNKEERKTHPRTRIQTRTGAFDTVSSPLITVNCDAVVSKDMFLVLQGLNTRNNRGVLPSQAYVVIAQSVSGVSGDDITENFNAIMPDLDSIAGPTGTYFVRFQLVINNSTFVVS